MRVKRDEPLSVTFGDSSPRGRAKFPLSVAFGDSSPGGRAKPPLRHADSGPQGFLRAAANTNEKRNLETGVIRVLRVSGR